jgi:hypothetical protein
VVVVEEAFDGRFFNGSLQILSFRSHRPNFCAPCRHARCLGLPLSVRRSGSLSHPYCAHRQMASSLSICPKQPRANRPLLWTSLRSSVSRHGIEHRLTKPNHLPDQQPGRTDVLLFWIIGHFRKTRKLIGMIGEPDRDRTDDLFHVIKPNYRRYKHLQDHGGSLSPCRQAISENRRIAKRTTSF